MFSNAMKRRVTSILLIFIFIMTTIPMKAQAALDSKVPSLSASDLSIMKGDSVKLYINNLPENVKTIWKSSNKSVASVSSKGIVKAKKTGEATITLTIRSGQDSHEVSCKVTVTPRKGDVVQKVTFKRLSTSETIEYEGKEICSYSIIVPKLTISGNAEATKKINKIFSKIRKAEIKAAKEVAGEAKLEADDESSAWAFPYYSEYYGSCSYHCGNLLSYISMNYVNSGGAHPNYGYNCMVFDLSTGKQVLLEDMFEDEAAARAHISDLILAEIEANDEIDMYWSNLEEILPNLITDSIWNIVDNEMVLTFSPYDIAAYAFGERVFKIKLSELGDYMTNYGKELTAQ